MTARTSPTSLTHLPHLPPEQRLQKAKLACPNLEDSKALMVFDKFLEVLKHKKQVMLPIEAENIALLQIENSTFSHEIPQNFQGKEKEWEEYIQDRQIYLTNSCNFSVGLGLLSSCHGHLRNDVHKCMWFLNDPKIAEDFNQYLHAKPTDEMCEKKIDDFLRKRGEFLEKDFLSPPKVNAKLEKQCQRIKEDQRKAFQRMSDCEFITSHYGYRPIIESAAKRIAFLVLFLTILSASIYAIYYFKNLPSLKIGV